MIWVDYLIIGIVLLSAIISVVRGFVKEVLSIANWVLSLWVAIIFYSHVATLLIPYIDIPSIRLLTAFLSLFIVTLVLGALVNHFISDVVDKTGLTGTDRALGILFGIVRGVAIVTLLVLLAGTTPMIEDAWWQNSLLLEHIEKIAVWARTLLPTDIAEYIHFS